MLLAGQVNDLRECEWSKKSERIALTSSKKVKTGCFRAEVVKTVSKRDSVTSYS